MRTELVEVPVAVLLHFVWRVDGQGPVGVHGDHHAADVRLQGGRHVVNVVSAVSFRQLLRKVLTPPACHGYEEYRVYIQACSAV